MEPEKTFDFERAVGGYRDLRDKKAAIEKEAKEKVAAINAKLDGIEKLCLKNMDAQGIDTVTTPAGTVYKKHDVFYKVADRVALEGFIERSINAGLSDALTLLNITANKESMKQYLKDNNKLPPGIDTYSEINAGFRKPTSKKGDTDE